MMFFDRCLRPAKIGRLNFTLAPFARVHLTFPPTLALFFPFALAHPFLWVPFSGFT